MRLVVFFFLILVQFRAFSQQWLGISASNYSGTYGMYANPANVADTRYKVFLNVAGANVDFINNHAKWGAPYSLFGLFTNTVANKHRSAGGKVVYSNNYLIEAQGNKNTTAFLGTDVRGPSLMFTLEKAKMAIGLTTRGRLITNLTNASPAISKMLIFGTLQPSQFGQAQNNNHVTANINGYVEMGLTLGKILKEDDEHFVKVGLTLKRVNALMNVHYLVRDFDLKIEPHIANQRKQDLHVDNAIATYGLTKTGATAIAGFSPKWLIGNAPAGFGYGFDAGFVYEHRPDYRRYRVRLKDRWSTDGTQNKYLYKFGLALLDIGTMRFRSDPFAFQTNINVSGIVIPQGTFSKIDSQDKLYSQMNDAFGLTDADYRHAYKVPLPAVISANFDYSFSERFYVNATWIQNLRNTNSIGMLQPSLLAVIPRWETKWLEVSVPVSLYNGYRNPAIGLAGRAGPLFLGSDNLPGLVNIGDPKGVSIYFGLFMPIYRTLPDGADNCYYEPRFGLLQDLKDFFRKSKQKRRWRNIR